MHANNKNKYILVLGRGPLQVLDNSTITAEARDPINFAKSGKNIVLSLHYNGNKSFLFVNGAKMYQFKAKDSEIKPCPLYLGNISKDFTINNMKKTGLIGVVKVFSVDYNVIDSDDILDIHRYLMEGTEYKKKYLDLLRKCSLGYRKCLRHRKFW